MDPPSPAHLREDDIASRLREAPQQTYIGRCHSSKVLQEGAPADFRRYPKRERHRSRLDLRQAKGGGDASCSLVGRDRLREEPF
jgi:hypothetical protein